MKAGIFVANQLHKYFPNDTLVKVGVGTAFLKDPNTKYSFGGPISYENEHLIMFHGLPKRIEVDGENLIELFKYEHSDFLAGCCILQQNPTCKFDDHSFTFEGKTYYDIEDVELLLT